MASFAEKHSSKSIVDFLSISEFIIFAASLKIEFGRKDAGPIPFHATERDTEVFIVTPS
ncbi:hypothetical protein PSEUDO9AZ_10721 [Pseudomonas sp. 9AZ]|nr:hypothetical protein PSEUDO9AZ_10721 [Pseudomonas sp. 9AZ]